MNKTNFMVDFGIFTAFLVAANPSLTGIPVHEWFSLAFAAAIVTHLLLHWKWVVTVGASFFRRLFHVSRIQFIVDALLFAAFTTVIMSGLLISRSMISVLGLQLATNPAWRGIHALSATGVLVFTGLHFALHWDWIVRMTKRYVLWPVSTSSNPQSLPGNVVLESTKNTAAK